MEHELYEEIQAIQDKLDLIMEKMGVETDEVETDEVEDLEDQLEEDEPKTTKDGGDDVE